MDASAKVKKKVKNYLVVVNSAIASAQIILHIFIDSTKVMTKN